MTQHDESIGIKIETRNRRINQLRKELEQTYAAIAYLIEFANNHCKKEPTGEGFEALKKWNEHKPVLTYFKSLKEIEDDIW